MSNIICLRQYITTSKRGKEKIVFEGYGYNLKESVSGTIIWRCCKRGCKGWIKTTISYDLKRSRVHSHLREEQKYNDQTILNKVRSRALETSEKPMDIVSKILSENNVGDEFSLSTPYLKQQITKIRRKNEFDVNENNSIIDQIRYNDRKIIFLQYDSGCESNNRILIFGTESDMIHLSNNKIWIIDGTFKVAPDEFECLLTIQSRIRGLYIPLLYILIEKKDLSTYNSAFNLLIEKFKIKSPSNIIIDFEAALFRSLKLNFPNVVLNGCLFHFAQILWRKIQNFGFTSDYKNQSFFSWNVRLILALAFVPPSDIFDYALRLKNYFVRENACEKTFILFNEFSNNFLISNHESNHDCHFWSVYSRTKDNLPRTTNSLEGYHRHLNDAFNTTNPNLFQFGKSLIIEQQLNSKKLSDSFLNYWIKKEEDSKKPKKELYLIVENYDSYYDTEYLKSVSKARNFPLNI